MTTCLHTPPSCLQRLDRVVTDWLNALPPSPTRPSADECMWMVGAGYGCVGM